MANLAPREEWNLEFVEIISKLVDIDGELALQIAEASDDAYNDGVAPEEAVYSELDHWVG